jgi:hypothetical protein
MDPKQLANMPTLEQQAIKACSLELDVLLKKYGCDLIFQEIKQNGATMQTGFILVKHQPQQGLVPARG